MGFNPSAPDFHRRLDRIKTIVSVAGILVAATVNEATALESPESIGVDLQVGVQAAESRLFPLPEKYRVVRHTNGRRMNTVTRTQAATGVEKIIYSNSGGQVLFRPGAGRRVADDLVTTLVAPCTLHEVIVQMTGGVEGGDGEFVAEISLYDGCPDADAGGQLIPQTLTRFTGLEDDLSIIHELSLDFRDRGICDDGSTCRFSLQDCGNASACVPSLVVVPTTVWVRVRTNSNAAAIVVGKPADTGYSEDGYHDGSGTCRSFFGGAPIFGHASFGAIMVVPATCPTHFTAYHAAGPDRQAFIPTELPPPFVGTADTRLADDMTLTVKQCELDAYELGIVGSAEPFQMFIDLRWPNLEDIQLETALPFEGVEIANLQIAHFVMPPDVSLTIEDQDQPMYMTWSANGEKIGAVAVAETQIGESDSAIFAFDVLPKSPGTWQEIGPEFGTPGVFHASIFCRPEMDGTGACCPAQDATPGLDPVCVDDVPVTSCEGGRWLEGVKCADDVFFPTCGTHACCLPDESCLDLTFDACLAFCDADAPPIACKIDADCPVDRTCGTEGNSNVCSPECGQWNPGLFCSDVDLDCFEPCHSGDVPQVVFIDSLDAIRQRGGAPPCAVDARQPHGIADATVATGWDQMIMSLSCEPPLEVFEDPTHYVIREVGSAVRSYPRIARVDGPPWQVTVVMEEPIRPGHWTCVEFVPTGREWCAGLLPGDTNQDGMTNSNDINALINSINRIPGQILPHYRTDIDRSGVTNPSDILRLLDLMNGAGEFEIWLSRSLPECPASN